MGLYDASSSTAWEENFICQWQFDKMHCIVAVLTDANTMAASEFDKYKYDCYI